MKRLAIILGAAVILAVGALMVGRTAPRISPARAATTTDITFVEPLCGGSRNALQNRRRQRQRATAVWQPTALLAARPLRRGDHRPRAGRVLLLEPCERAVLLHLQPAFQQRHRVSARTAANRFRRRKRDPRHRGHRGVRRRVWPPHRTRTRVRSRAISAPHHHAITESNLTVAPGTTPTLAAGSYEARDGG